MRPVSGWGASALVYVRHGRTVPRPPTKSVMYVTVLVVGRLGGDGVMGGDVPAHYPLFVMCVYPVDNDKNEALEAAITTITTSPPGLWACPSLPAPHYQPLGYTPLAAGLSTTGRWGHSDHGHALARDHAALRSKIRRIDRRLSIVDMRYACRAAPSDSIRPYAVQAAPCLLPETRLWAWAPGRPVL